MARVLGVGGVFFRSDDPKTLAEWYQRWLGVPISFPHGASFPPDAMPPGGATVWSPFPRDTKYFDPPAREFMFNLVVDDLEGALKQVREGGAETVGGVEDTDYGRFGWFIDPEGNKVELWQPKRASRGPRAYGPTSAPTRLAAEPPPPRPKPDRRSTAARRARRGSGCRARAVHRPARLARLDRGAVLGPRRIVVVVARTEVGVLVAVGAGEDDHLLVAEMDMRRETVAAVEPDQNEVDIRLGVEGEPRVAGARRGHGLPLELRARIGKLRQRRRREQRSAKPGLRELGGRGSIGGSSSRRSSFSQALREARRPPSLRASDRPVRAGLASDRRTQDRTRDALRSPPARRAVAAPPRGAPDAPDRDGASLRGRGRRVATVIAAPPAAHRVDASERR